MGHSKTSSGLFYFCAPFVLALAVMGIWLAARAAYENYRTGLVADQIIVAVSRAREMNFNSGDNPARAQTALLDDLAGFENIQIVTAPEKEMAQDIRRGIKSPWGRVIRVFVTPQTKAIRLEVPLSAAACRGVLGLYAEDAVSLGLQRVDIRDDLPSALWQFVYDRGDDRENRGLQSAAIQKSCQRKEGGIISLTFSL